MERSERDGVPISELANECMRLLSFTEQEQFLRHALRIHAAGSLVVAVRFWRDYVDFVTEFEHGPGRG